MIYDATEQMYTIALANFATDLAALAAAKSVSLSTAVDFIKRQSAEVFTSFNKGLTQAACGVYVTAAATNAKNQGVRDSELRGVYDYYLLGSNPETVAKQTELAAEALLLSVDRIAASGLGVFGAGEMPGSVSIDITEAYVEGQAPKYWRRAIVRFPVNDRDMV